MVQLGACVASIVCSGQAGAPPAKVMAATCALSAFRSGNGVFSTNCNNPSCWINAHHCVCAALSVHVRAVRSPPSVVPCIPHVPSIRPQACNYHDAHLIFGLSTAVVRWLVRGGGRCAAWLSPVRSTTGEGDREAPPVGADADFDFTDFDHSEFVSAGVAAGIAVCTDCCARKERQMALIVGTEAKQNRHFNCHTG